LVMVGLPVALSIIKQQPMSDWAGGVWTRMCADYKSIIPNTSRGGGMHAMSRTWEMT
jgi:hypothetical protein